MKKLLFAIISVSTVSLFSQQLSARDFGAIYTECGLGAMLFPTNPTVAAITNVTWDLGTTAISSNASSEESCNGGQEKTASLIYQTYPQLEKDISVGSGEHLTAMLDTAGCSVENRKTVSIELRSEMSGITGNTGYQHMDRLQKSEALYNAVKKVATDNPGSCTIG